MSDARVPEWALRARAVWRWRGVERPPFATPPADGQESVWDYPRPPRLVPDDRRVLVRAVDLLVADSCRALRVLETASPPTWYLPPADVRRERFVPAAGSSRCEWKGAARYWTLRAGNTTVERVAWSYPDPLPGFEALRDYFGFYPAALACTVDGQAVTPQPGGFYAGWITPEVVGPFKGEPGSEGW